MDFVTRLQDVRRRPGAYGLDGSYVNLVAFINGADAATDWELLQGFRPWLAQKLGHGANLVWWSLVEKVCVQNAEVQKATSLDDARMCECVFDLLTEFFAGREV